MTRCASVSLRAFTLFSITLFALTACSDDPVDNPDVNVGCRLNSDCPAGEVCEDGACVDSGECVGEDCPCTSNADCGAGEGCNTDSGECFALECFKDADCALGEVCSAGVCVTDVDADRDRDGVPDAVDLCPEDEDPQQEDGDGDGQGDACDLDDDNDGLIDTADNCPLDANTDQFDSDEDGVGNACDEDFQGLRVSGSVSSPLPVQIADVAAVTLVGASGATVATITPEGEFAFEGLSPGVYGLEISAAGHLPVSRIVPLENDDVALSEIALIPQAEDAELAVSIRGQVALADGATPVDVVVRARIEGGLVDTTLTDEEGKFSLVASRLDHTLEIARTGYQTLDVEIAWNDENARFEVDGEGIEDLDPFVLSPDLSATASGRLTSTLENLTFNAIATVTLTGDGQRTATIEPDGDFAFGAVRPGIYGLTATADGHLPVSFVVSLVSGNNALGDIALTPEFEVPEAAATLTGQIALAGQNTHEGATVLARIEGVPVATTITSSEGLFSVSTARLDHTLTIEKPGFIPLSLDVIWSRDRNRFEANGTPLAEQTLTLSREAPSGTIRVVVDIQPDWIPAEQRRIEVQIIGDDFVQTRQQVLHNNEDGAEPETFTAIPDGTFFISLSRAGFSNPQQVVALTPDNRDQTITLTADLRSLLTAGLDLDGASLDRDQIAEAIDNGVDFRLADLSGIALLDDYAGLDLDLAGTDLSSADLSGADLTGANLAQTNLFGADLTDAALAGINLTGANLSSANLAGAALRADNEPLPIPPCNRNAPRPAANLAGAIFNQTNLEAADLSGLDMAGINLASANLGQANLSGACLANAELSQTNLTEAVFDSADMTGASLTSAILRRTSLRGVTLQNASLTGAVIEEATFECIAPDVCANLERANLNDANLVGADFTQANLDDASLLGVTIGETRTLLSDHSFEDTFEDASGQGFDAVPVGNPTFVDGPNGRVLSLADEAFVRLDGITALLDTGEPIHFETSLRTTDVGTIVSFHRNNGQDLFTIRLNADGHLRFIIAGQAPFTVAQSINDDTPHALTVTILGNGRTLITLDGVRVGTRDLNPIQWNLVGRVSLGQEWDGDTASDFLTAEFGRTRFERRAQTTFERASLRRAQVVGVLFGDADLTEADFTDANMRSTVFNNVTFTAATFAGADLTDVSLSRAALNGVDFGEAILRGGQLDLANLTDANFDSTDLSSASMRLANANRASMIGVDLTDANMRRIILNNADLTDATLTRADLTDASVNTNTTLEGNQLTANEANFTRVDLSDRDGLRSVDFEGANFTEANLSDTDLSQADIDDAVFTNATLTDIVLPTRIDNTTFRDITLDNHDFSGRTFQRCDFSGASLNGADFTGSVVTTSSFSGAALVGAIFNGIDLRSNSFGGASLIDASLDNANMTELNLDAQSLNGASMQGTILNGASMSFASLQNADLTGASLRGTNLQDARLSNAVMIDADLRQSTVRRAALDGVDLTRARLNEATFFAAFLSETVLTDANLTDTNMGSIAADSTDFSGTILTDTNFLSASLVGATFDDATGTGTQFGAARLSRATFRNANLANAVFRTADLTGAVLSDANLTDANFIQAVAPGLVFRDGNAVRADFSDANLTDASFNRTDLGLAIFVNTRMTEWSCTSCVLNVATFRTVQLTDADFSGSDIIQATFEAVFLGARIDFSGASLQDTTFEGTQFVDADFSNAALVNADSSNSLWLRPDFSDANLFQSDLNGIIGAIFSGETRCPNGLEESQFNNCGF